MNHFNIKDIPLRDLIESKMGGVLVFYKMKSNQFFVYTYSETYLFNYDELGEYFFFDGHKYTVEEFTKLLNMLVFI